MTTATGPAYDAGDAAPAVTFATYLTAYERGQLDARAACAEQERDDALADLQAARAELARVTAERDRLRILAHIGELAIAYVYVPPGDQAEQCWHELDAAVRHVRAVDATAAPAEPRAQEPDAVDALTEEDRSDELLPEQCDDCETTGYNCPLHADWPNTEENRTDGR